MELLDTQWDVNVNKDSDSQGKIVNYQIHSGM